MPELSDSQLIRAFDPRVTSFQTQAFSLSEDLEWLEQLRAFHSRQGVILHSTRIVEVLGRQALSQSRLAEARRQTRMLPG